MTESSGGAWGDPGGGRRGLPVPGNPGAMNMFKDDTIMLIMKNRGTDTHLTDIQPRKVFSYVSQVIPNIHFCKRLQDGNYLMKIDKTKKEQVMSISKIEIDRNEIPVNIFEAGNMNNTKVSIKHKLIKNYTNEELLEDLQRKNEGILAVQIQTDWDKVKRIESNSEFAVVTLEGKYFNSDLEHKRIELWWEYLRVQLHIPQPNRCKNCHSFDHFTSKKRPCNQPTICGICGKSPKDHIDENGQWEDKCNQEQECINCRQDHPAWSKTCKRYKEEQATIKKMTEERISYKAAKYQIKRREDEKRSSMATQMFTQQATQPHRHSYDKTNNALVNSEVTQVIHDLRKLMIEIVQALQKKNSTNNDIINTSQDDMSPSMLDELNYTDRLNNMNQPSAELSVLKNTLARFGEGEGESMEGVVEERSATKRASGGVDTGGPSPPQPKRQQVSRREQDSGGKVDTVVAGRGNNNPPASYTTNRSSRRSSSSSSQPPNVT